MRQQTGIEQDQTSLLLLQNLGSTLRQDQWEVTAILDMETWDRLGQPPRLIDLRPGASLGMPPLWAVAIDIGTTTVTVWLVDLITGDVRAQVAQYNHQISRGEDVVSRIIFASKDGGKDQLRSMVLATINELIEQACKRVKSDTPPQAERYPQGVIVGNSTMIHLLLGIPPENIRAMPFITTVNQVPTLTAKDVGPDILPDATVDCLPGVASYVGADITATV